jgi:hypothetical protein
VSAEVDQDSPEYKIDCLIWLLHEERLRTIRLAQVVAGVLAQQNQPAVQQMIMAQLLNVETPIQGAPPVLPGPLPTGAF